MAKILHHVRSEAKRVKKEVLTQMLTLSTSAFGLVAALAWNQFITEFMETYIRPLVGESSKLISSLIYAVIITLLAVLVTYNLTKIIKKR